MEDKEKIDYELAFQIGKAKSYVYHNVKGQNEIKMFDSVLAENLTKRISNVETIDLFKNLNEENFDKILDGNLLNVVFYIAKYTDNESFYFTWAYMKGIDLLRKAIKEFDTNKYEYFPSYLEAYIDIRFHKYFDYLKKYQSLGLSLQDVINLNGILDSSKSIDDIQKEIDKHRDEYLIKLINAYIESGKNKKELEYITNFDLSIFYEVYKYGDLNKYGRI